MEPILISVIVPVYNVKEYLTVCVNSILSQTYSNIEIILVDDGSTDGSAGLCDEFAVRDPRVRVIHKKNGGLVSARKAGAAAAKGEYILNVDGDDWIGKNRVADFVRYGAGKADMVYMAGRYKEFPYHVMKQFPYSDQFGFYSGQDIDDVLVPQILDTKHFFLENIVPSLCAWGIKRVLYKEVELKLDDALTFGEDIICIFRCIMESDSILCIEQSEYHYVVRSNSIIDSKQQLRKWIVVYIEQMMGLLHEKKKNVHWNHLICQFLYFGLMIADYPVLVLTQREYLFPYPKVKKGSRVVVYGAGKVGGSLAKIIDDHQNYYLVGWVDTKRKDSCISNDITEITDDYDFVVIAVLEYKVSSEIKLSLIEKGIPEEKIAMMSSDVLQWDNLSQTVTVYGDGR